MTASLGMDGGAPIRRRSFGPLGLIMIMVAQGAAAQATREPTASNLTLDEIVVTAQKRSENLQDVPIAVSAVNAKQIEERFARDVSDLVSISPNLFIDPLFGVQSATIAVRGLVLNEGEKSFDPAVAVYLDGMYLATNTGALLNLFDAESVEVLRGPQGTLFGRNTIGGLIQIRRTEPTGQFGGKVVASYGRFDAIDTKATVNLPAILNDTLSAKFSVVSLNGGGYFHNDVRGIREGNTRLMEYSTAIKYQPMDAAKFVLNYDHIEDNSNTRPITSGTLPGQLFCSPPAIPGCGAPITDSDFHLNPVTAIRQPQAARLDTIIGNGSWKLTPEQELVTVLGYRIIHENSLEKFDAVEANLFYVQRPMISKQSSAELRYQLDFNSVKAVVGAYYFNSFYHLQQQTFFFGGEVPGYEVYQNDDNYAGFAQLDWKFLDHWNMTLGGRYSEEKKQMCGGGATGVGATRTLLFAYGDCTDAVKALPLYTAIAVDTVTGATFTQDGKASFSSFTPKATLTYDFNSDLVRGIAYGTYSKGARSGGFNGRSTSAFSMGPYQPEKVTSYEVGTKTEWMDRRLQLNLTAFYLDYKDKQEQVVFPDPVAVTVTVVQNAAKARIYGTEAEFKFVAAEGLTIGGNVSYLNTRFKDYLVSGFNLDPATAAAQPTVTIDKSNFNLQRAPKYSADINGRYAMRMGEGSVVFNADYNWRDKYYLVENSVQPAGPTPAIQKSYGLLNASVGYETAKWSVTAYGKNLTNARYFQQVLDIGTTYGGTPTNSTPVAIPGLWTYGTIAAPVTWGVEGMLKF